MCLMDLFQIRVSSFAVRGLWFAESLVSRALDLLLAFVPLQLFPLRFQTLNPKPWLVLRSGLAPHSV